MAILRYILNKIKDRCGSGIAFIMLGVIIVMIGLIITIIEHEHNLYIDEKSKIETGLISACKAAVLEVDKSDIATDDLYKSYLEGSQESYISDKQLLSQINVKLDEETVDSDAIFVNPFRINDSTVKSYEVINKNRANTVIETLITENGMINTNNEINTLRKHLILRAYLEPKSDKSIQLTMYGPSDYGNNLHPLSLNIDYTNETTIKNQIESEINNFISNFSINGKEMSLNILNTGTVAVPELKIERPCCILFLQDYPIKTFLHTSKLSVFYMSPSNIKKKVGD